MLTPRHRALFAASYSSLLLRSERDEPGARARVGSGPYYKISSDNRLPAKDDPGTTAPS
jgi:hypothetical protein